jgi:hypothetical protein
METRFVATREWVNISSRNPLVGLQKASDELLAKNTTAHLAAQITSTWLPGLSKTSRYPVVNSLMGPVTIIEHNVLVKCILKSAHTTNQEMVQAL